MNSIADSILICGPNPFDNDYKNLQQTFDLQIVHLITEILVCNVSFIKNHLITDIRTYRKNPDRWIVEQIVNGSAEMSSSTLILTPESEGAVQYTYGIGLFRPQLYYKARSLRDDNNIYLIPFSSQLWVSLLATTFSLILVLTFILSREAKLPHEISYDFLARIIDVQQDKDESATNTQIIPSLLQLKEKWELGEILLTCIGAACQQGSARDPSTNAARILVLCMFGLALIGYTAYSASVISFVSLIPSTEHEQIKNLDYFTHRYKTLLYNINKIKDFNVTCVQDNTPCLCIVFEELLIVLLCIKYPVSWQVFFLEDKGIQLNFSEIESTNLKKGFEKALEGNAVFAGDRDISLTFLHEQNYCLNLRCTLGRTSFGIKYHRVLAVKKNSNHTKRINYSILRMKELGLINREEKQLFHVESLCTIKEKLSISNFVSFSKKDVRPVLNLFKIGVLTSLFLLLIENIIFLCPKEAAKFLSIPIVKRRAKM